MIVFDASALFEVLFRTPATEAVEDRLFAPGQTLHAPYLIDIEVAQVVRRHAAAGEINTERGREDVADFADLPLRQYEHGILLPRIWELRHNLTAYNSAYVALAEALGATLLTRDKRLAVASGHRAQIEVV
jgi:predicted nucleic acid-binding protein